MELKVWVEGVQRIVQGISETTTCQDVVFALAHATGKTGRFTLIERWRKNERPLAPSEHPLKILMKWGEYSSDVQFILQRFEQNGNPQSEQQIKRVQERQQMFLQKSQHIRQSSLPNSSCSRSNPTSPIRQLNGISGHINNATNLDFPNDSRKGAERTALNEVNSSEKLTDFESSREFNSADVRNSLELKVNAGTSNQKIANYSALVNVSSNKYNNDTSNSSTVSSNGSLVPPPYRNPPSPSSSSPLKSTKHGEFQGITRTTLDFENLQTNHNIQYKDLVQIINQQREKINLQKASLSKFDSEIEFLEEKSREQLQQLEFIIQELNQTDQVYKQGYEQLQTLQYVEEESELVKQQEKTLKSEINLLRSRLTNCDAELFQCNNRIRSILDEIQFEQRNLIFSDGRQHIERNLLSEIERIQSEIDLALHNSEQSGQAAENLKKEITLIEMAINEKKRQLELLIHEMKEVNLQSLTVAAPGEEVKALIEPSSKAGSSRRIIGSPRQLENAVPTNRNPHGVWV